MIGPFLKGVKSLSEESVTEKFPERRESLGDNERGVLRLDVETCISCSACERICPNRAIDMVKGSGKRGGALPQVSLEKCIFCGFCEEVCPTKCLTLTKGYDLEVYDRSRLVRSPDELRG